MSDIYSGNVYAQIKSPCRKRFPSPLNSTRRLSGLELFVWNWRCINLLVQPSSYSYNKTVVNCLDSSGMSAFMWAFHVAAAEPRNTFLCVLRHSVSLFRAGVSVTAAHRLPGGSTCGIWTALDYEQKTLHLSLSYNHTHSVTTCRCYSRVRG